MIDDDLYSPIKKSNNVVDVMRLPIYVYIIDPNISLDILMESCWYFIYNKPGIHYAITPGNNISVLLSKIRDVLHHCFNVHSPLLSPVGVARGKISNMIFNSYLNRDRREILYNFGINPIIPYTIFSPPIVMTSPTDGIIWGQQFIDLSGQIQQIVLWSPPRINPDFLKL
jgi:hypothetical protein